LSLLIISGGGDGRKRAAAGGRGLTFSEKTTLRELLSPSISPRRSLPFQYTRRGEEREMGK